MKDKDRMNVEIAGTSYPFSINSAEAQFKIIFITHGNKNSTEVYTYG
jgi:hypothetical protein